MKYLLIVAFLFAVSAKAACLPSRGTVVPSSRLSAVIWDIQMPGHSYRVSVYGNWIAMREDGIWKRTEYQNILSYRPNASNVTTCQLSKILWMYQARPELWSKP